jgi:hypothetical protein
MGLIITNEIETSIGENMSNTWCTVIFHTQEFLITGNVQCDLNFYRSEADHDSGKDKLYPVVNTKKVDNCTINISLSDEVKASGRSTAQDIVVFFYGKVKSYLESTYNWTITL